MKATIEKAIKTLAGKAEAEVIAGAAMQYAQAALSLAHVLDVQANTERQLGK